MTINCKMCGCPNNVEEGQLVCTCTACGNEQTIPNIDNEKKALLFDRANAARMKCDFSKSFALYSQILIDYPVEAEAYFGLCLSKYGIEYVDDKKTNKKIPTCHRTLYNSIFDDVDYKEAIKYADVVAKRIYQSEAEVIDKIQKGIISISQKETPYDIFICYKETTEDNHRTRDSYVAEDIYNELTKKGYKVFFSRITLESKLGQEYEPIIFNALQTSKIMLVIGSKAEYFNATWVKNEWSRYLQFMEEQKGSKYMIPCFRDMEAYDMPDEFLPLQSQNLDKLGAKQDLLRAIDKIFGKNTETNNYNNNTNNTTTNKEYGISAQLKRSRILIEDKDFKKAEDLLENILTKEPECSEAYFLLLLVDLKVNTEEQLSRIDFLVNDNKYYKNALKFANEKEKEKLVVIDNTIRKNVYKKAKSLINSKDYKKAKSMLESVIEIEDSKQQIDICIEGLKENTYNQAAILVRNNRYDEAIQLLEGIKDYKDSLDFIASIKILKKQNEYQKPAPQEAAIYDSCLNEINNIKKTKMGYVYITHKTYEAVAKLESIRYYKDSNEIINMFNNKIKKIENGNKLLTGYKPRYIIATIILIIALIILNLLYEEINDVIVPIYILFPCVFFSFMCTKYNKIVVKGLLTDKFQQKIARSSFYSNYYNFIVRKEDRDNLLKYYRVFIVFYIITFIELLSIIIINIINIF